MGKVIHDGQGMAAEGVADAEGFTHTVYTAHPEKIYITVLD